MRIAIYQGPEQGRDVAGQLELMAAQATAAADRGVGLLVFPEMFLTGYAIGSDAVARMAEPADGPSAQTAGAIARASGIAIAYGYPEQHPEKRGVYNAALLVARDGRPLMNYRKTHLFGDLDRGMFVPGDRLPEPVELEGMRVGMLICYDVEFPEPVRCWALAGVDLLLVPTAQMEPYEFVARLLVPARAYENQLTIAYANRCGREGDLVYVGQSCVCGPDGADLARAGSGEAMIVADLEPAALQRARGLNTYLADRRPGLYGALANGQP
jgi:predicted amidohydrolase